MWSHHEVVEEKSDLLAEHEHLRRVRCVAAVHCASDSVRTRESVCVSAKSDGESAGSRKAVSWVRSEKTVMLFTMSAMEPKAPTTRLSLERLE